MCTYSPFIGKREIGDKTRNEAGGKPPAPPVQPRGSEVEGSEVEGSELGGRN